MESPSGSRIDRFRSKSAAAVLAYIAVHDSRPVTRDELADAVWPESGQEESRQNLRTALSSLRRQLDPPGREGAVVGSDRLHVWLCKDTVTSDLAEFQRLTGLADRCRSNLEKIPLLTEALHWIRGDALAQVTFEWALPHQLALEEAYAAALCDAVDAMVAEDHARDAVALCKKGLTLFPLREDIHVAAIRAYGASGLSSEAIKQFETLERVLDDAWGEKPGQAAVSALQAVPEAPDSRELAAALSRRSGPAAGLKGDTARPFGQVEPSRSPALPPLLKRFFGRKDETGRLKDALDPTDDESPRLWTVTGVGGTGKSALALRVGHALAAAYEGRTHFVSLTEVRGAEWFLSSVCEALDLPRTTREEDRSALVGFLSGPPSLLILDGFERLVDGASEAVRDLLVACPNLRILVTSRRTSFLEVERVLSLQPLPVPEPGARPAETAESPSVKLFVDRTQAQRPDFELSSSNSEAVVQICRRLDGLPLALELAAAHMTMSSPAQLLVRLEDMRFLTSNRKDVPDRHRSLAAVMESSYELLDPQEQALLRSMGCFRGGAGLDGIEAVFGEGNTFQTVEALCGSSLLLTEDTPVGIRFRMLEPVREFAWQRCKAEGEDEAVLARHREWCCEVAKRIRTMFEGRHAKEALALGDAEHDNFRLAADTALLLDECPGPTLTMVGKLLPFTIARGHTVEWRVRGRKLLAMPSPQGWARETAIAYNSIGHLSAVTGHVDDAIRLLEESKALLETADEPLSLASCLNNLGNARLLTHDVAGARSCWEAVLESTDEPASDDPGRQTAIRMAALGNLAGLWRYLGEPAKSQALFEEALASSRERGQNALSCELLADLSQTFLDLDRPDKAVEVLDEAESEFKRVGAASLEGVVSICHAWCSVKAGDVGSAVADAWRGFRIGRELESPTLTANGLAVFCAAAVQTGASELAGRLREAATIIEPGFETSLAPWQRSATGMGERPATPGTRWSDDALDQLLLQVSDQLAPAPA